MITTCLIFVVAGGVAVGLLVGGGPPGEDEPPPPPPHAARAKQHAAAAPAAQGLTLIPCRPADTTAAGARSIDRIVGIGVKLRAFCVKSKILPIDVARTSVVPNEPRPNVSSTNLRMLPNSYCEWRSFRRDVRRDDEHGHAKSQLTGPVELRRHVMVEKAAPVVPHDDDRRRIPVRALPIALTTDATHAGPFVFAFVGVRMVGVDLIGNHPR